MGTHSPHTRVANTIRRALRTKQPIEVNGKPYTIMLTDLREAPVKDRLLLSLAASHGTEHHFGDLLIRRRRFADPDLIAALVVDTARQLIVGHLPPRAVHLA
jgi:hypothetical protein